MSGHTSFIAAYESAVADFRYFHGRDFTVDTVLETPEFSWFVIMWH